MSQKMNQLLIQPLDVWLFRDGRPFAAGSDHRAESLFPPFPSTTLGAIRRRELVRDGSLALWETDTTKISPVVGEPIKFGASLNLNGLTLRGPFVTKREQGQWTRYHPQPADARIENEQLVPVKKPAAFSDGVRASSAKGLLPLGLGDEYEKESEMLWLAESQLQEYLKGNPADGLKSSDLFLRENRIGIGMNNATYTVTNGALYEVEFIRPHKDVGLSLLMDGYNWSAIQKGFIQLGGESRAAHYEMVDDSTWPTNAGASLPKQFKVYFATPAYFEGGWQPVNSDWSAFFGKNVNLVSAAIGRYISIGGFDVTAQPNLSGAHRPSRRFVPAGSVYYFQSNGASLLKDSLTEFGGEMGLGQILIEEW